MVIELERCDRCCRETVCWHSVAFGDHLVLCVDCLDVVYSIRPAAAAVTS